MKGDLDIDSFMKQMKLGSTPMRSRSASKRNVDNSRITISEHLRTVDVDQRQASPSRELKHKLEKFEQEYGESSSNSFSKGNKTNSRPHESNLTLDQERNKSNLQQTKQIKYRTVGSNSEQKLHFLELSSSEPQYLQRSQLTTQKPDPAKQTFKINKNNETSRVLETEKKKEVNNKEINAFMEQMKRLINTESSSISFRINQFTERIREHIEKEYERFKNIMIGFVEDFFMISKAAFVLAFEKKSVELNASFYVVQSQLLEMSRKLESWNTNPRTQSTLPKIKTEINESSLNRQVQQLVEKSMRLQSKTPHVDIKRDQLIVLQKAFKHLLSPWT